MGAWRNGNGWVDGWMKELYFSLTVEDLVVPKVGLFLNYFHDFLDLFDLPRSKYLIAVFQ